MPFSLKKQYGASEKCLTWVVWQGNVYTSVIGSGYTRVYDQGGNTIYNSGDASGLQLFTIANKLFIAMYSSGINSLQIMRWNGSAFVVAAYANSFENVYDWCVYNGEFFFIASRYVGSLANGGSGLFKFTGANSGGLTKIKEYLTGVGGRFMTCMDIDQATGDIYYGEHGVGVGTGLTKIIKRTQAGIETELIFLNSGTTDILGLRIFDGNIHYVRQAGSDKILARLDSFTSGASEINLGGGLGLFGSITSGGQVYRLTVFDSYLWIKLIDKVYKYLTGSPAVLFDTLTGISPFGGGDFTTVGTELILGAGTKFVTTTVQCDLVFGTPSYSKTNETAVDADDGTITVHATSSFYTQYSIDNVAFQSSNVFLNLAPGSYDIFVKDNKGCTIEALNIIILEFNPVIPPGPVIGTNLVIDERPVNENNYVTWFNAVGDTAFNTVEITNCVNGLPRAYRLNKLDTINHYPIIVNGEQFSFYINFINNYTDPAFTSYRLFIINNYGVVQSDIAPLMQVFQPDNLAYYIYASVTTAGLLKGVYRLAIANVNDAGRILLVSNEFKVLQLAEANPVSALFQYRNSVNIYNYLYQSIPDYIHQVRLKFNVLEDNAEGELTQYRAVSSGKLRNVWVELDLSLKIEMYYFNYLAHRATFTLQIHDFLIIGGKSYVVKSLYKPDWADPGKKTSKGILEIFEQAFSMANRYGNNDSVVIIGSDDPLLLGDGGGFIKL